jgi:AraC-like DNA-binding protein
LQSQGLTAEGTVDLPIAANSRPTSRHLLRTLEGSVMPVSEVTTDSGYEDKTYFYREFKKKFGNTPAEYRQSARRQTVR